LNGWVGAEGCAWRCRGLVRVFRHTLCYAVAMTRDQVKEILERVLSWPPEQQADAARLLTEMEAQHARGLRLSDEQVAAVKRRLAEPDPKFVTLEEVRERFARGRG